MKIGLLRETKTPVDNRVAFSPMQCADIEKQFGVRVVAQPSDIRVFNNTSYNKTNIETSESLEDCDILFGIKEVAKEALIPNKHYVFFSHTAKKQPYNRELLAEMVRKKITLTDYEYITDHEGKRVCAFGYWAGFVGAFYTIRMYGLRKCVFNIPPSLNTMKAIKAQIKANKGMFQSRCITILVTGKGRVSKGITDMLDLWGIPEVPIEKVGHIHAQTVYAVAGTSDMVKRKDGGPYDRTEFHEHPERYKSDFDKFRYCADMLICGHSWQPGQPVYVDETYCDPSKTRIRTIGDITCDINGSIKTTVRPSTHNEPFYDVNIKGKPVTFTKGCLSVMAVDTCPNALPFDASVDFGNQLIENVLPGLLKGGPDYVRGMILKNGEFTPKFKYLEEWLK